MALSTVNANSTAQAADLNQVVNVLTGTDAATQVVLGAPVRLNTTAVLDTNAGVQFSGHLVGKGSAPTLGALQTGISTQSISGTDARMVVTLTPTVSPPGANSVCAIVNFAAAYAAAPVVVPAEASNQGGAARSWITGAGSGSFNLINGFGAMVASVATSINAVAIG